MRPANQKNKMKILFISRKYPPSVGGMQNFIYELIHYMDDKATIYKIASEIPVILLPLFYFYVLFNGWKMRNDVDIIHLCDGSLAPLGVILKLFTSKPVTITV